MTWLERAYKKGWGSDDRLLLRTFPQSNQHAERESESYDDGSRSRSPAVRSGLQPRGPQDAPRRQYMGMPVTVEIFGVESLAEAIEVFDAVN
ncbi:hypothetical protein E2562_006578 [Oryza meyeriana var. granulata]|uniref:Uncharacterized protein n=1 Tax=Oryza meyeriana var. granulata TaxID=110450 RepID=A0A6G1EI01_9ORYZ|nr:hypothetical protein E2562_006578 [Oryza meyeriana var. granulata]